MPALKPLRDFDTHDVINHYKFNPSGTYPTTKGTFVKILSGLMYDQNTISLGNIGQGYPNTLSTRWGVSPSVATCTSSGDVPLGMLLYDVRETDENGERLVYHPDKAAQMQVSLSGLPVPIVTRGWFVYSGVEGALPTAPGIAYLGANGGVSTSGNAAALANGNISRVGKFLGPADANGFVYLKIEL
jgi:hypothetical protein